MRGLMLVLVLLVLFAGLGATWLMGERAQAAEQEARMQAEIAHDLAAQWALMERRGDLGGDRPIVEVEPGSEEEALRLENQLLRQQAEELQAQLDEMRALLEELKAGK
jgi:alpha-ketoglutarate-dependent taurine dioxygenase